MASRHRIYVTAQFRWHFSSRTPSLSPVVAHHNVEQVGTPNHIPKAGVFYCFYTLHWNLEVSHCQISSLFQLLTLSSVLEPLPSEPSALTVCCKWWKRAEKQRLIFQNEQHVKWEHWPRCQIRSKNVWGWFGVFFVFFLKSRVPMQTVHTCV